MVKLTFDETMEMLLGRHATKLGGNAEWIDWDAVYADLIDVGYETSDASVLLDEYIDKHGY